MSYKNFIFDIDGTIIDNEAANLEALQIALDEKGVHVELDELRFSLGIPSEVSLKAFGITDIEKTMRMWGSHYQELCLKNPQKPFSGIEDVIKTLKKNKYTLGIVTSKDRIEYRDEFENYEISKYFDGFICTDDTFYHKPNGEPLLAIIKKLNINLSETIYIGDAVYDMECAQNAGVDFGIALWGAKDLGKFNYYSVILNKPDDILDLI